MTEIHSTEAEARKHRLVQWLSDTATARLASVLLLSIVLTWILVVLISWITGVSVREGRWATLVGFQYFAQLSVARLSDWVSGTRDKSVAAIFSTFTLGATSLVLIVDVVVASTGAPDELSLVARQTLFGSISCVLNEEGCVPLFRTSVWVTAAFATLVTLFMAKLLKSALGEDQPPTQTQHAAVFFVASIPFTLAFFLLHHWEGEVLKQGVDVVSTGPEWLRNDYSPKEAARIGAASLLAVAICVTGLASYSFSLLMRVGVKAIFSIRFPITEEAINLARIFRVAIDVIINLLLLAVISSIVVAAILLTFLGASLVAGGIAAIFSAALTVWVDLTSAFSALLRASKIAQWYPLVILVMFVCGILAFAIRSYQKEARGVWSSLVEGLKEYALFLGRSASEFAKSKRVQTSAKIVSLSVLIALLAVDEFGRRQVGFVESPPPDYVCGVCVPLTPSATEQSFSEAGLSCTARNLLGRSYWAFGSSEYLTHDLDSCRLDTADRPATLFVVGLASRDDRTDAGFRLSLERATAASRILKAEYPAAEVIAVAMGRNRSPLLQVTGVPDIYLQDRQVIIFAAPERIATPVQREALDVTVERLLKQRGLFDRYEYCGLVPAYWEDPVIDSLDPSLLPSGCIWLQTQVEPDDNE